MKFRSILLAAAFAAFAVVHAAPLQYTVVVLHPESLAESIGYGIGFGQQVGMAKWNGIQDPNEYATLWTGTPESAVNLNPTGAIASVASDTDGTYQVGSTQFLAGQDSTAAMWHGTAASYINMAPVNSSRSFISAMNNGIEIGGATISGTDYSGYWTGPNPNSWQALPSPINGSQAIGISGNVIVGEIDTGSWHAYVWNIGTHTNQDLHPTGWDGSILIGTDGIQHVGQAFHQTDFQPHAGVWNAATGAFTELHPAGNWMYSLATDVYNGIQIGSVHGVLSDGSGFDRAALWQGTAASYEDLQQFLPSTYVNSYAGRIDTQGNIIGIGMDHEPNAYRNKAVMWVPLVQNPPPYTFLGFFSPLNDPPSPESEFKGNRSLPIRFSLALEGLTVINAHCTISLDKLDGNNATPIDVSVFGKGMNDGANFRFDGEGGKYFFNLDTKDLEPGRYRVTATVEETGQTHSDTFVVAASPSNGGSKKK